MKEIIDNIKKFRELKSFTREMMADKLEMSVSGYSKLERGEVDLTLTKLYKIADLLEVSVSQILKFDASQIFNVSHNNVVNGVNGIEVKELYRDDRNKLKFKPPISPIEEFRAKAKQHLENTFISIKAKNKIATININTSKKKSGTNKKKQLTPRGQLHLETVYGSIKQYVLNEVKVGANFNEEMIATVANKKCREALLNRLIEFDNDPKKAFTGKNSLDKNPLYFDKLKTYKIPEKVKTVTMETIYTIRKDITPELKLDKIIDPKVKSVLEERLKEFGNDTKKAFGNLDENPIWLNKEKGIAIKRVAITGISNAQALHDKKDKGGNLILDEQGNTIPVDFVNTGNNHHVAIYKDEKGNLQENVIAFFEATERVNQGLPIIDKTFKEKDGWQFLFSMKQNEYFIFPNETTGFNPLEIDLLNPENNHLISPNLFRVQKFTIKDYFFRHHLETNVENINNLKGITWLRVGLNGINNILKVRINHIGQIISIGEY